MKLTKVEIRNFRSIADETISFKDFPCRILIGKNETGKSNVLKAISTLSPSYDPAGDKAKYDKRMKGSETSNIDDVAVTFYFDLEATDIEGLYSELQKYFYCKDFAEEKLFETASGSLSLRELLIKKYQLVHRVNLKNKIKQTNLQVKSDTEYSFCHGWLRIPDECSSIVAHGNEIPKGDYKYSNYHSLFSTDGSMGNLGANVLKLMRKYGYKRPNFKKFDTLIKDTVKNNPIEWSFPEVILWNKLEDQNLHAAINLHTFMSDPKSYPHFKSMCLLCESLFPDEESIKSQFSEQFDNLAYLYENIQEKVTSYLKNMWPEIGNEEIIIDTSKGNETIRLSVKKKKIEKKYGISISSDARSDGFKKFLKLLLSFSLTTHNKELSNKIILIDEAEIYLHPSSAEYFTQELIKLSNKGNIVVFSTHSPFMIDPNESKILRHIITEKEHEITKLVSPKKGKIYHEELLWRAIGCGILRSLAKYSILFEGYYDWKLFKIATHKDSPLEGTESFSDEINEGKIATANASGVRDFQNLAPLFQAAESELFILCDSDQAGQDAKKSFVNKKLHGSKNIYTFADLQGSKGQTAEDYIEIGLVQKVFNEYCTKEELNFSQEQQESPQNCLDESKPVLSQIESLLARMTRKESVVEKKLSPVKEMKDELKELIFKDLKTENIRKNYATVLTNLYEKIKQFRKEQEGTT